MVTDRVTSSARLRVPAQPWHALARPRLIAAALLGAAFVPTGAAFIAVWQSSMPQGFAAFALSAWLVWRDRHRVLAVQRAVPWAIPVLGALSLLWFSAGVLSVQVLQLAVLPMLVGGWLLATGGWPPARAAGPALAVFALAVPLWDVLTRPLQTLTVLANAGLLRLTQIDASIDGDFIQVRAGTFHVAEGCAGIDYFQIGLLVGVSYALLFVRTWPVRIRVVAVAVTSVIVMNWLRVFGLIVIGHASDMRSPLLRDHGTYGWILFSIAIGVAMLVARRLEAGEAARLGARAPKPHMPWPDAHRTAASRSAIVLATGLALTGPLLEVANARRTPPDAAMLAARSRIDPPAGWQSITTDPTPAFTPGFHGADLASRSTWARDGYLVQLDRLLYATQSQGKELIMYGNAITPDSLRVQSLASPTLRSSTLRPEASVVRTARGPVLVWHWYRVAERLTASPMHAKLLELPAMLRRDRVAEVVAVSARCHRPGCGDAAAALSAFLDDSAIAAAPVSR